MEPPSSLTLVFLCLGIALILLLVCSALISGSEVAFFSLSPKQLNVLKESTDKQSRRVVYLLTTPDYLLGSILQINNLVNILIVLLSTMFISLLFDFQGNPMLEFLMSTLLVTFVLVLFGEVMPKILASYAPVKFARLMSRPLIFLSPLTRPFNFCMSRFAKRLKLEPSLQGAMTLEDLSKAVDIATVQASEEKKILKGIVNLPVTDVRKIMKPRGEVVAIDLKLTNGQVMAAATECGFSRLPVYEEDLDHIKGFLYIKDMLPYLQEDAVGISDPFSWHQYIREAYYVPESMKIDDLLEEFRGQKIHLAVVVDEYGGTDGIVTLEDILEEIVGEIVDETDFRELKELSKN